MEEEEEEEEEKEEEEEEEEELPSPRFQPSSRRQNVFFFLFFAQGKIFSHFFYTYTCTLVQVGSLQQGTVLLLVRLSLPSFSS